MEFGRWRLVVLNLIILHSVLCKTCAGEINSKFEKGVHKKLNISLASSPCINNELLKKLIEYTNTYKNRKNYAVGGEWSTKTVNLQKSNQKGQFVAIGNNEYVFVPSGNFLNTNFNAKPTKRLQQETAASISELQQLQNQFSHTFQQEAINNALQQDSDINGTEISSSEESLVMSVGKYSGGQLWKIHTTDTRHLVIKKIKKYYGGEIWDMNVDGIDMFFDDELNAMKAKSYIDTTDVTYNIMIDDVQAAINDTFKIANLTKENVPWLRSDDLTMTWDRYQDLQVFDDFYYYVVERFSQIAQQLIIGRTHEKRDIKVIRISNGNPNNDAFFIDAGMQAREWIGPAALTLAISRLLYSYKNIPHFMKNVDWYFLPILNPDGYEYTRQEDRLWSKNRRKNRFCQGVNLDRNFDYQWGKKGSVGDPCSFYYRGPERFSEPESLALRNFLLQLGNKLKTYISIGSYGQVITYPWGDDDFVPNTYQQMHNIGKKIVKEMRKATGGEYQIGSSYSLKFARSGNSADWVMDTITPKFVFNVFLRDQGRYGYLLPPTFIVQSGFDVYEIMKTVAEDIGKEKLKN